MTDFQISTQTNKSFPDALAALKTAIADHTFTILHIHDVQATFASKGISHGAYQIIEFCRAPAAKQVLDAEPLVGLLLPCKIVLFEQGEQVIASAMLPTVIDSFFPGLDIGELPQQIEAEIREIISSL